MRVSVLQENLHRGLGIVGRAVATRSTLPITTNVLLATDDSRLRLSATNLEIATSCWIGAKVEQEGAITVPARLLTEFVASLPPERIDLQLAPATRQLHLQCARNEARLSGQDAEDFPPIPSIGEGPHMEIKTEELRTAIQRVVFAAAADEARPVLTGVHFAVEGRSLTLAAADGFRLAVNTLTLPKAHDEVFTVIVPARSLRELERLLAEEEDPVAITVNRQRSQVLFRLKNVEMVSQLIQGTFPNYKQLVPESHVSRAVVDAAEFLRATRTAAIFARDGNGIVRLYVTPGEKGKPGTVRLASRSEEVGENEGAIDALVEGEEAKIAFNSKYLTDVLSILNKGQIAIETINPSSPGVIKPVGATDYVHVVMPMFVQW